MADCKHEFVYDELHSEIVCWKCGYVLAAEDKMAELKPCPFCGGTARMAKRGEKVLPWVYCSDCLAETRDYDSVEEAAEAWNRRVGDGK